MQLLVDKGLLGQLRTTFKETRFIAPRAAVAQCLSLFASMNRFRDVVGVRYGFVSSAIARLIMFHADIGMPELDMVRLLSFSLSFSLSFFLSFLSHFSHFSHFFSERLPAREGLPETPRY